MKKLLITLTSVCLLSGIALAGGCENNADGAKLTYDKKYIRASYVGDENENDYFIFKKDGTGIYANYNYSTVTESHYKGYIVNFDYKISGDKAACTYHSVASNYDYSYTLNNWNEAFEINEDFIFVNKQYGTIVYICENYLESIPEFGK